MESLCMYSERVDLVYLVVCVCVCVCVLQDHQSSLVHVDPPTQTSLMVSLPLL